MFLMFGLRVNYCKKMNKAKFLLLLNSECKGNN